MVSMLRVSLLFILVSLSFSGFATSIFIPTYDEIYLSQSEVSSNGIEVASKVVGTTTTISIRSPLHIKNEEFSLARAEIFHKESEITSFSLSTSYESEDHGETMSNRVSTIVLNNDIVTVAKISLYYGNGTIYKFNVDVVRL